MYCWKNLKFLGHLDNLHASYWLNQLACLIATDIRRVFGIPEFFWNVMRLNTGITTRTNTIRTMVVTLPLRIFWLEGSNLYCCSNPNEIGRSSKLSYEHFWGVFRNHLDVKKPNLQVEYVLEASSLPELRNLLWGLLPKLTFLWVS